MFWDLQIKFIVSIYKAHKQSTMTTKPDQPVSITYNVTGTNSRVNINSKDSSVNTVTTVSSQVFVQLRDALRQIDDPKEREQISSSIDSLESSCGTRDFIWNYQQFMSVIADHMTVFMPFLPALARLLA
jgi:hypothetical protein